jgi:hypothetical protein
VCDPTALAAASFVITGGSAVAEHDAQRKADRANKREAGRSMIEAYRAIDLRADQEIAATQQQIAEAQAAGTRSISTARVAAGESGVAGVSVDALLDSIQTDVSQFKTTSESNLDMTLAQLEQEKRGVYAQGQSRANQTSAPNPLLAMLKIAGAGVDLGARIQSRKPPKP